MWEERLEQDKAASALLNPAVGHMQRQQLASGRSCTCKPTPVPGCRVSGVLTHRPSLAHALNALY